MNKKLHYCVRLAFLFCLCFFIVGCNGDSSGTSASGDEEVDTDIGNSDEDSNTNDDANNDANNDDGNNSGNDEVTASPAPSLADVDSWAYWLTDIDVDILGKSRFDLVVIDYSADGTEEGEFTTDEITRLKNSGKIVLAYLSIGEAEMGRFYFGEDWVNPETYEIQSGAPTFLVASNPNFPDNFKVRYWDPEWQAIFFGNAGGNKSYLDRIIDAGFDGVYLDIIEAFEYFGPEGESGENRATAASDMIDFIEGLADHSRQARGANFLVFGQNGEAILDQADGQRYMEVINGVGIEDLYYTYEVENDGPAYPDHTAEVTPYLDQFAAAGKKIFVIDYVQSADKVNHLYETARTSGYVPYASMRDLNELTVNEGHDPE